MEFLALNNAFNTIGMSGSKGRLTRVEFFIGERIAEEKGQEE